MSDNNFDTDIAVVGMAGRFAGARNIAEFWNNLRDGVESLTRFTEAELLAAGVDPADLADPNYVPVGAVMPDMEGFDAKFFGFSPREASIMDPQHRHFLEVSWEALENAGHVPASFKGSIGVFGGSGHNAYMPYNLLSNPQLMRQVGFFLVRHTGNDKDFLTTRVSYLLNLKGPSVNVQTACSTSLVAIHLGVQSLLNRECDMALAGGVTIELPHRHGYVYRESEILSPDGHCHAFDANSQGTVFGSGAGVVVLRRLSDAIKDGDHIHAVIKGSAVNNDGALKVGYMAPSVDGQAQAIAEALAVADVDADTITYIEAHGTGTPVGDPIEVAALTQAFRQSTDKVGFCGIGSVKSNIGHADTAAGVANVLKVALAMQHQQLPPSLFFQANNPACEFERSPFYVNHTLKAWTPPAGVPRRAGVSSLGVGGTNAHVVMQEAPKREPSGPSRPWQLLVQSARSLTALDAGSAALAQHLQATRAANSTFADAAHTLRIGRQAMKQRRVVVARDAADAAQALQAKDAARVFTDVASDDPRSVAFMFAGGGAQHPNMGLDLYRDEPVFRAALEQALAYCESKLSCPLREVLFPAAGQEAQAAKQLEQPSLALPALLAVQVAQARLLMSWGIQPAAMIGHSMGEYTAAHLAGVFSLEDALTLVALRGRLFESLPEGAMLSVPLGEEALRAWMTPELSISVVNAPNMTVVGGPVAAIEALQAKLAAQEIDAARVRINVAAHSSMLEPILQPFAEVFQRLALKAPTVPFVSNLSGTWITPAEATDPAYWVKHLRNTVRFADGVQTLLQDESRVLLEVGPGRTLSSLARQHPARKPQQPVINSMRHPDEVVNDQAHALTVLGRLWAAGVDVPWAQLQGQEKRLRVPLPTYAFDHARHWVEPGRGVHALPASERSLHKRKDLSQWFYQPSWQTKSVAAAVDAAVAATPDRKPNGTRERTLVFADHHGVADTTVATLRALGDDVVVVRQGKAFKRIDALSYTVVPGQVADMDRLVEALTADDRVPSCILHAWSVTRGDPVPSGVTGVTAMRRLGFDSLLSLAQAMGREDWSDPIQLLVLCDGLQRVAGEGANTPAKALLLGPTSVIPREFSNVRCALMDIDAPTLGSRQAQRLTDGIVAELRGDLLDPVVAWRGGQRWVQGYTAEPLAQPAVSKLRQRGVYLITGGLGGVGLALASHLANTVQARLVLLGRTALPPRDQWERVAADSHTATSMAQRLQQLLALERAGADVMVVAADVTNVAQMQSVLKQVRERFGDINGVLHTAGVLNDGVMQLKEAQAASAVLAPKVDGTLALETALHSVQVSSTGNASPLDFMVLFSSISAFAGLAGQVDYAAANAYLDAYAQDRFQRDGTPVIAINWSQWQEVGMAAALAQSLGIEPAAVASPTTTADTLSGETIGHPFVDRCLRRTPSEHLYETRFSRDTHWLLEEHRVRDGEALIPGTGYLEIVRTAFAHAHATTAGQAIALRNVTFLAPFAAMPGQARDLRVRLQPYSSGPSVFAFSVTGRPADADASASWAEHVRGLVSMVTPTATQASPPDAIAQRCTERLQQGSIAPVHLHFGPRWRNVTHVHYGRGEALMQLALPEAYAADLTVFPLHPALMDLATAGAQSLLPGFDESRDFFVPASYEQITVHAALTTPCFSHIRARLDEATLADNGDDLATFDVTITDSAGRILVDVNGFTMIRVRDKALLAMGAAHETATPAHPIPVLDAHAATPALKPRATANTILASGMRDGMLSSEGAAVLERVLAWGAGPQIIVSPQDLHGLLAQWHAPPAALMSAQANGHPDGECGLEANPGARAPITPTEQLIAQMWGEMLGHSRVAATDNFFDLGGHSLLAVQVINKLKKRTGKALPLTALLEAPTVEELAALIEPPGTLEAALAGGAQASAQAATASASKAAPLGVKRDGVVNRTLIPIRKGEGRPPLFLVHDGNGETLLYRTLANKLDPQHAVYGLQPAQRADASFVDTSITAMATAHIEQLRSVQPHGPYLLGGLCAGGVVAHEMALQLQQAGEKTAYLGLMDAADVAAPSRGYENSQRWQRFLATLEGDASTPLPLRVAKALPTMAKKVLGALRYQVAYRMEHRRLAKGIDDWQGAPGTRGAPGAAAAAAPISFLEMYELAHLKHQPQGVMQSGEAVLYRAKQGTGDDADVPFIQRYADEALGWQPRFMAGVKVTEVPGGHASLLQEPNVQTLAMAVQRDIDQALLADASFPAPVASAAAVKALTIGAHPASPTPSVPAAVTTQRATEPLESP
jgi:acyl transferase domain-containing protein